MSMCVAFCGTLAVAAGCSGPDRSSDVQVRQHGGMREVLREEKTQPRVSLQDVVSQPGAIAVGALAGLGGEVTIVEGDVWVARSHGTGAHVSGPDPTAADQATLLTASHVPDWAEWPIDAAAGADLERQISLAASSAGLDTTKPFPFIIEGNLVELDAHVIAGSCPIANPDGEAPWRFSLEEPERGQLVGFFAQGADGVMTHHGSSTHMHVVLPRADGTVTAHADYAGVGDGAIIRLPR
jgi:acetolactate decarboxylase